MARFTNGSSGTGANYDEVGCLNFPASGEICNIPNSSGDGYGYSTFEVRPDTTLETDQYLIIDPTAPNHIHIRAGGDIDASTGQLFLGGELANVSIWDGAHEVYISSYDSTNDYYYAWNFGNEGILYGPAMGGLWVTGISGKSDQDPLYITSADSVLLDGVNGEFLNDASNPSNQIATIGDVDTANDMGYISVYSTADQGPFTANTIQAFTFTNTDFSNDITLVDGSKIRMEKAGKYNIAFSAQLHQTNSSGIVNIWLRKNGNNMAATNTKVSITSNNPYYVAAWNLFVDAAEDDYFELIWSSDSPNTKIEYEAPTGSGATEHPSVPSIILTANQIAGTGLTPP